MSQRIPFSDPSINKTINHEQLNQIIEAILAGEYSWACFLLLRCTGYDPLQYIPYRTYNRLVKKSCQVGGVCIQATNRIKTENQCSEINSSSTSSQGRLSKIKDLSYIDLVGKQHTQLRGGNLEHWLDEKALEYSSLKEQLVQHKNQILNIAGFFIQ
jgi:hypothetical protein